MANITRTCTVTVIETVDGKKIQCEPSAEPAIVSALGENYKGSYTADIKLSMPMGEFISRAKMD